MTKRIRFAQCPDPANELIRLDKMYSNWLSTNSPYLKEILISAIDKIQPYVDVEILYEGINYNI